MRWNEHMETWKQWPHFWGLKVFSRANADFIQYLKIWLINVIYEWSLRMNQEGGYHRSPMSKEDLQNVFEKPFKKAPLQFPNAINCALMKFCPLN